MKISSDIKFEIIWIIKDNNIESISALLKKVVVIYPKLDQIQVIEFWNKWVKYINND